MLTHLGALLGAAEGPAAGTGSEADPWHVTLAAVGPIGLDLTAWAGSSDSGDGELHLGLRVGASLDVGPTVVEAAVRSEIVDLTLPASGSATARPLGRHEVRVDVTGPLTLLPTTGVGLTVQGAAAQLDCAQAGARNWSSS
jgi:hypothetical protein